MSKSKIIDFPNRQQLEPEQPEQSEIPEINIDELTDIDYAVMYAENEDYVCTDKCYRCGHVFTEDDHIWKIEDHPGYESKLDSSYVSISICDDCLFQFIEKKDKKISDKYLSDIK